MKILFQYTSGSNLSISCRRLETRHRKAIANTLLHNRDPITIRASLHKSTKNSMLDIKRIDKMPTMMSTKNFFVEPIVQLFFFFFHFLLSFCILLNVFRHQHSFYHHNLGCNASERHLKI